jgi:N-acetylglucosaminyldiphosphoundecaprenol N-acetyl-beta-D-mannosaminyltransferase
MPDEKKISRVNVLGIGISALNLDLAVEEVRRAVEQGRKGYVCVTGVHGVSEARKEPGFRKILNTSFLNTPDGMPMVWMGRLQGVRHMGRVYGPDLMLRMFGLGETRGLTHFFYGGAPGVAEELKRRMERQFPGSRVVGCYTPPFRALTREEETALVKQVEEAKPQLFWVGLSTPKQEKFMADYWQKLNANIFLGVGAAFDFHAGRVRQAPVWMQRSGLEWLFRLGCEPKRLWKRYLKNNPLFVLRAAAQLTGLKQYPIES